MSTTTVRTKEEQQALYRERVKEITGQLEEGLKNLFHSEQYRTWLDTMAKFHTYSVNNTILIALQKPDASLVAGYNAWKNQHGRMVKKGEKAIHILAPTPYKQSVEIDRIDPYTQEVVRDENGNPMKDTVEITRPAFKIVSVFDISQTEGPELPTLGTDELTGTVEQYDDLIEALKRSCPVPVSFEPVNGNTKGYYDLTEKRIVVRDGMSQLQTIKTMIHEMAHQKLHADVLEESTRNTKEVEAESVAYTVCRHYDLDTSDYSFGYIAGWSSGKEMDELKSSLQTIRTAAYEMIQDITKRVQQIEEEHHLENLVNDLDQQAEILARKVDRFIEMANPFEYRDTVESQEKNVAMIKEALLTRNDDLKGLISWLENEMKEDPSPDFATALEEIREFSGFEKKPEAKRKREEMEI